MVAIPPLRPQDIQGSQRAPATQEQSVGVQGGLVVYSHDGSELGRVGEFIIDPEGNLTSFIVRPGGTTPEVRVWMSWIHSVTRERIVLRLTTAEVLAASASFKSAGTGRRKSATGR